MMKEMGLFAAVCGIVIYAMATNTAFATGEKTITIDNLAFTPAEVKVKAGTRVVFVNRDDLPHSVVSMTSEFRSKTLDTGESFIIVFGKLGEIAYFCGLHGQMRGKIIVTP